jgi:hypothetical protein
MEGKQFLRSSLLLLAACALAHAGSIPLTGYFCASCPANANPIQLFSNIHPSYTTVVLAFVGWDDNGTILNSWDCDGKCGKNFTLTKDMVDRLKV